MTDDPKLPSPSATPADTAKKADAQPTPAASGDDGQTKAPQSLTFGQHVFIWAMILLVGVIFGVGSTWGVIEQGSAYVDPSRKDVTEADVTLRSRIAERLEKNLNPMYGSREFYMYAQYGIMRFMQPGGQAAWADHIRLARLAEAEGLLPSGDARERIVQRFLAETGPGNRSYAAILNDMRGGKDEVNRAELSDFLAERSAVDAIQKRHSVTPVIPEIAGEIAEEEQITVTEAELSADGMLPTVGDDDPELATTFESVKGRFFTTPATVDLSVAAPDMAALTASATAAVTDSEISAHFEAHKANFTKPKAGEAGTTEPKTLPEATDEIRTILAGIRASERANELTNHFADTVGSDTLAEKDAAAFAAAAAKAGLTVSKVTLSRQMQAGATYTLGALGTIYDQANFFTNNPGLITNVMIASGTVKTPFVARLDARHEAGHRSLKDDAGVRTQVKAIIAGRRAWKDFIAKAEAARAAAEQVGLSAWAASEAGKAWKPKLDTKGAQQPDRKLAPPPTEAGGSPGEARLLAELTMPTRPIAIELVADGNAGVAPKVRLVQVTAVTAAKPVAADPRMGRNSSPKETYEQAVERYQRTISNRRLQDRLDGK